MPNDRRGKQISIGQTILILATVTSTTEKVVVARPQVEGIAPQDLINVSPTSIYIEGDGVSLNLPPPPTTTTSTVAPTGTTAPPPGGTGTTQAPTGTTAPPTAPKPNPTPAPLPAKPAQPLPHPHHAQSEEFRAGFDLALEGLPLPDDASAEAKAGYEQGIKDKAALNEGGTGTTAPPAQS